MQKSATVKKQQRQEPIKENITELQNKRNSMTKQTSRYKAEVQEGASVLQYTIAGILQDRGLQFLSVSQQTRYRDDDLVSHLKFYSRKY